LRLADFRLGDAKYPSADAAYLAAPPVAYPGIKKEKKKQRQKSYYYAFDGASRRREKGVRRCP